MPLSRGSRLACREARAKRRTSSSKFLFLVACGRGLSILGESIASCSFIGLKPWKVVPASHQSRFVPGTSTTGAHSCHRWSRDDRFRRYRKRGAGEWGEKVERPNTQEHLEAPCVYVRYSHRLLGIGSGSYSGSSCVVLVRLDDNVDPGRPNKTLMHTI